MNELKKQWISLEEETRNGYHISSDMKKLWNIEFDLLMQLDQVCKKIGAKYFLDSGTLLGAVRDGRFIPWDDDIDVIMLREDYDLLLREGKRYFAEDTFLQCAYTDKFYPRGHAQLRRNGTCAMLTMEAKHVQFHQGIFIDIFVMDGVAPDSNALKTQFVQKERIMDQMRIISVPVSSNPIKTIVKQILRFGYRMANPDMGQMFRRFESICEQYNHDAEYVDKIMFRKKPEQIKRMKREWFAEAKDISFEGYMLPVPVGYDQVLRVYFGDNYMTPVQAPSMHSGLIIDTERSYTDVLTEMK